MDFPNKILGQNLKALTESCDTYSQFGCIRCVPVIVYFKSSTRICQKESVNFHIDYGDSVTVDDRRESKVILHFRELAETSILLGETRMSHL